MQTTTDTISTIAQQTGILMMTLAATIGMVELPESHNSKVTVNQPAYVFATNTHDTGQNAQRREREEAGPHYISYSASMRTPGRTGKI